jgi:hypothetical protein
MKKNICLLIVLFVNCCAYSRQALPNTVIRLPSIVVHLANISKGYDWTPEMGDVNGTYFLDWAGESNCIMTNSGRYLCRQSWVYEKDYRPQRDFAIKVRFFYTPEIIDHSNWWLIVYVYTPSIGYSSGIFKWGNSYPGNSYSCPLDDVIRENIWSSDSSGRAFYGGVCWFDEDLKNWGDSDGNCEIGWGDYTRISSVYGKSTSGWSEGTEAFENMFTFDSEPDGVISFADVARLFMMWGETYNEGYCNCE